jgi:hypothetical protein
MAGGELLLLHHFQAKLNASTGIFGLVNVIGCLVGSALSGEGV